jgi:uncharacterized protein YdaU (DUF1376 family)
MNYFELHIGDYAEATAHLTFVEDAAYIRLLRKYYATERPLPADLKAVQRLVGARTKEEKNAVQAVLEEFFSLQADGWHNARCDAEIAKFQEGEPEREAKKSNEEARLKRHREERARLFSLLNKAGLHAPWNISMGELREMVKALPATPPDTPVSPLPETAPATPATATQTPDTNHQTPVLKPNVDDDITDSSPAGLRAAPLPTTQNPPESNDPAIKLSVELRALGVECMFTHPAVQDWTKRQIAPEVLHAAISLAREQKGPTAKIPANYLVPIVEKLLNPPPMAEVKPQQQRDSWEWKRTPGGIEAKGRELGMFARGTETHADFAKRIEAEIEKRRGAAA